MPKIEIEIGGDNSELERKIAEAEVLVKNLRKDFGREFKLGNVDAAEKIQVEVNKAKASLKGLQTEMKSTSVATAGMSKSVGNGGNTLMQFSRIAQDAPFGIMGIGNNITATTEAFGHLQKSTGSTGAALKAMAGSLLGSGGILLAVSLVTSALTYMSQNNLSVADVVDKLTGKYDEQARALRALESEAVKSSQGQISSMKAYVSVAENVALSMKDRMTAVEKLQSTYPAYFGNLTKEQILNGDVASAVSLVTKALIAKAKAEGFAGKVSDNAKSMYDIDQKVSDLKKLRSEAEKNSSQEEKGSGDQYRYGLIARTYLLQQNDLITEKNKLNRENLDLEKRINKESAVSIALEEKAPPKAKKVKADTTSNRAKINSVVEQSIVFDDKLAQKELSAFYNSFGNASKDFKTTKIDLDIPINPILPQSVLDQAIGKLSEFDLAVNEMIQNSLVDTFGNLGTVIGDALANGGNVLEAVGSSLIQGLSGLLSAMGGKLIELGTAAVLAGTVTKLFGTITGIGAGIAAIAGGVVLKGISSSIVNKGGGVGGGSQSNNTGGNSYQSSGGSNSGFSSNNGSGTVVFRIAGQDLIGVLSNTLDKNSRLGGAITI